MFTKIGAFLDKLFEVITLFILSIFLFLLGGTVMLLLMEAFYALLTGRRLLEPYIQPFFADLLGY